MYPNVLLVIGYKTTLFQASSEDLEERTDLGLVKGHAYGITAAKKIDLNETKWLNIFREKKHLYLLRLQNPWGKKELTQTSVEK